MEPAPQQKSRADVAALLLMIGIGCALACVLAVTLVWPFAVLYIAVSPEAAYFFVAGCIGFFSYGSWRLIRRYRISSRSP